MKLNSGDSVRPPRREPIVTGFAAERLTTHDAKRTSWNEDTDLDATMPPRAAGNSFGHSHSQTITKVR